MVGKALQVAWRDGRVAWQAWRQRVAPLPSPERDTVAIVRPDRIGDFVLASPTLVRFREAFPKKHLTLFAHPAWLGLARWLNEMPVVEGCTGWVDAIEPFHPDSLTSAGGFRFARETLARYQTVVYPVPSRTNAMDLVLSGLPGQTLAAKGGSGNQFGWLARRLEGSYTRLVDLPTEGLEHLRNAAFLQGLSADAALPSLPPFWDVPRDWVREQVAPLARRMDFDAAVPYVAISPFTSVRLKDWPLASFAETCNRLRALQPGLRVLWLGSQADRHRMGPWCKFEGSVNLAGETTLIETVALLAGACVSFSGDTAAAHIASAVGTPAVVVLGGGHYGRFFPYSAPHEGGQNLALHCDMPCYHCNWVCRYRLWGRRPAPCIERVTPDQAVAALVGVIERAIGRAIPRRG